MKRFLFFVLCFIACLVSYGQSRIYSSIMYLDKFDDTIMSENIKTLVTKTDSTFIVEVKDFKPVTYYILNKLEANSAGDKGNIVNLVANVYGYQTCWCVVREDMVEDYNKDYYTVLYNCFKISYNEELTDDEKDELQNKEFSKLEKYYLFVIHRVIVTQYTHSYESEYFWIEDELNKKLGGDIHRIVYKK